MLTTSPAFRQAALPNETQKLLLVLLAIFVPPLPIYLLTAPRYTIRTKEFLISVLFTLLMPFGGFLYAIYFICIKLPEALSEGPGHIRIGDDLEAGEDCLECADGQAEAAPQPKTNTAPSDGLPTYEEAEGSSDGATRAPIDTKFTGDNKVQH